jgi:hypothetical protein
MAVRAPSRSRIRVGGRLWIDRRWFVTLVRPRVRETSTASRFVETPTRVSATRPFA